MNWNHYMTHFEEWERFDKTSELNEELRMLVIRINYNKTLLCSDTWIPSKKDIIIHKERFSQYLDLFNEKLNYFLFLHIKNIKIRSGVISTKTTFIKSPILSLNLRK